jgi:hypothetical protein
VSTIGFLLRAQARRSWVSWVGIGLVLALTAGVAIAGMAGARRTASIVICIALVLGIPLGILGGRLIWSAFAEEVGAPGATSVVPWLILVVIAAFVALVANLAALAPAVAAARTKAAAVLRAE